MRLRVVSWPSAGLLLALVTSTPQRVVAIDPSSRTLVWQRTIDGAVRDVVPSRDGVVVLASPAKGIGPVTITTVGLDGSLRSVVLDRTLGGFQPDRGSDPGGESRGPGMAVDPIGGRAYVVGADEPVAEVDLASLGVRYHGGSRMLAKGGIRGSWRSAVWLGNGLLAVTGAESKVRRDADGNTEQTTTPSGLLLTDTRSWTTRLLQRDATTVTLAGGSLLAYGGGYDSAADTSPGAGLTIYGLDGTRRAHLFSRTPLYRMDAEGRFAYVWFPDGGGHVVVVRTASGRVVANLTRPGLALLTRD